MDDPRLLLAVAVFLAISAYGVVLIKASRGGAALKASPQPSRSDVDAKTSPAPDPRGIFQGVEL